MMGRDAQGALRPTVGIHLREDHAVGILRVVRASTSLPTRGEEIPT
jgi:hypothetical protein